MTPKPLSALVALAALLGTGCSTLWHTEATGPAFAAGVYRIGGGAGLNFQDQEFNGADTDTLSVNADIGRFFTANLEGGVRGAYSSSETGTVETDEMDVALFVRWYTETRQSFRPWVEVGGGMASVDTGALDLDGTILFFALGLTHFLSQSVAGEVFARQSVGDFDDGVESDTLDLGVGFSFFW